MKITRHIHYEDSVSESLRFEMLFDPPMERGTALGGEEPWFKLIHFQDGVEVTSTNVMSPVNSNGLLHITEVNVNQGDLVSVCLRTGHRIKNLYTDTTDRVQIYVSKTEHRLMYLIQVGQPGAFEITAEVVVDDDHFYTKLKANPVDVALRAYFVERSMANTKVTLEAVEKTPDLMTRAEAAAYLRVSPRTLQRRVEEGLIVPARGNKYRRAVLDHYLDSARGKKKT